jgi:hypothetical protein
LQLLGPPLVDFSPENGTHHPSTIVLLQHSFYCNDTLLLLYDFQDELHQIQQSIRWGFKCKLQLLGPPLVDFSPENGTHHPSTIVLLQHSFYCNDTLLLLYNFQDELHQIQQSIRWGFECKLQLLGLPFADFSPENGTHHPSTIVLLNLTAFVSPLRFPRRVASDTTINQMGIRM